MNKSDAGDNKPRWTEHSRLDVWWLITMSIAVALPRAAALVDQVQYLVGRIPI